MKKAGYIGSLAAEAAKCKDLFRSTPQFWWKSGDKSPKDAALCKCSSVAF